jgi:hypothetical protein
VTEVLADNLPGHNITNGLQAALDMIDIFDQPFIRNRTTIAGIVKAGKPNSSHAIAIMAFGRFREPAGFRRTISVPDWRIWSRHSFT